MTLSAKATVALGSIVLAGSAAATGALVVRLNKAFMSEGAPSIFSKKR